MKYDERGFEMLPEYRQIDRKRLVDRVLPLLPAETGRNGRLIAEDAALTWTQYDTDTAMQIYTDNAQALPEDRRESVLKLIREVMKALDTEYSKRRPVSGAGQRKRK